MTIGTKPAVDLIADPSLVQALLQEQHPDLAHLPPVKVAEGWDNVLFRLADELAVRLPRRAASATLIAPLWSGPPLWLHGDLHPGNLLVSDGRLSGVIDFGDRTSGDPATDLSLLWMLQRSIRSRFEAWAGDEPDAMRMRARGWALALGLAYMAQSRDDAAMAALGRRTINAALDEP